MQDVVCMYTSILRKYTETVWIIWACSGSNWGAERSLGAFLFTKLSFVYFLL